jgi:hypothetical protein
MPPSVTIVVRRLTKHPKKTTKEPAGPDIAPHPPRHCTPPRHCERSAAIHCLRKLSCWIAASQAPRDDGMRRQKRQKGRQALLCG